MAGGQLSTSTHRRLPSPPRPRPPAEYHRRRFGGHSVAPKLTKDNPRFYASITTIPRPDIELDPLLKGIPLIFNEMPTPTPPAKQQDKQVIDSVKAYYGEVLKTSEDLKTSVCTTAKAPSAAVRAILMKVPEEVKAKYYGCGSPFPLGMEGLRVLDLGCGSGRDCYVCSSLVGPSGSVTGLDMTPSLLEVARRHADEYCTSTLGYAKSNLRFVEGQIERLGEAGIADSSIDLVISNCVVNLSPDKAAVLREAYRALAPGGEMHFSDIYCDRRLPQEVRTHPVLLGECLGGALYVGDFMRLAREAGFLDPRRLSSNELKVSKTELTALLGGAKFFEATYRLFKVPGRIETLCEDYGQAARYKGTLPESPNSYQLDSQYNFQTGKWYEVCGNTAAMVAESWLAPHFEVVGDRSVHYGMFVCGAAAAAAAAPAAAPVAVVVARGMAAAARPCGPCCK